MLLATWTLVALCSSQVCCLAPVKFYSVFRCIIMMSDPFLLLVNSSLFLFLSTSVNFFPFLCCCSSLSLSEHASQREWISQHRQRPRGRRRGWDLLYPAGVSISPSFTDTPFLLLLFLSFLTHLLSGLRTVCILQYCAWKNCLRLLVYFTDLTSLLDYSSTKLSIYSTWIKFC